MEDESMNAVEGLKAARKLGQLYSVEKCEKSDKKVQDRGEIRWGASHIKTVCSDVENQLLSPVKRIHSEQRLLELMALQRMRQNAKKLMFLKKRRFDYEDDPYGYV
ncbi:unnamed protein product [Calicophoron daubneyi]|uniref:Uncharacterized protein n=1 Tax=Calicophoron daubneyi TaxID=300641 RepID=A0AAV2TSQ2_CALDB